MPKALHPRSLLAALSLAILPLAACAEDALSPRLGHVISAENPFVVSGAIRNRTSSPVTQGARVVVAWQVVSGTPDYLYTFGEGTVAPGGNSFEIRLTSAPPAEALNSFGLGVGVILLVTDGNLRSGQKLDGIPRTGVIGAASRYSIIYADRDPAKIGHWVTRFPRGFSVGRGVKGAGAFDFESFEPVGAGLVELIVDSLEKLDFVDWA